MADGLRTSISPVVAGGEHRRRVSGSAMRTSTPGTASPTVSSRQRSGSCTGLHAITGHLAGAVGREPAHAGATGDGLRDLLGHRRRAPHDVAQRRQVEVLQPRVVGHARARSARPPSRASCARPAIARSDASRSKRGCRRNRAPAATAVTMLSRPRMCTGGVAIWKRSLSVSPSAVIQCSTPWPIERWVWRTAFGKPVVPELNTSTASASTSSTCQTAMLSDSTGGSSSGERRELRRGVRERRPPCGVGDREMRCHHVARVRDLAGLPRRAAQHHRRAQLQSAVQREHELGAVRGQEHDARAGLRACVRQDQLPRAGARLDVAVGVAAIREVEHHAVTVSLGAVAQHL